MAKQEVTASQVQELAAILLPKHHQEELKQVQESPADQMTAINTYAAISAGHSAKSTALPTLRECLQFTREFFNQEEQANPRLADFAANAVRELHNTHVAATGDKKTTVRDTVRKALALVAAGEMQAADMSRIDMAKARMGEDVRVSDADIAKLWAHTPLGASSFPARPTSTEPAPAAHDVVGTASTAQTQRQVVVVDEDPAPQTIHSGTALALVDNFVGTLGPVGKIKVEAGLGISVAAVTSLAKADGWRGVEDSVEGMVDTLKTMREQGTDIRAIVRLVDEGVATPAVLVRAHRAAQLIDVTIPELVNPDEYSAEAYASLADKHDSVPLQVAQDFMDQFGLDDESAGLEESELGLGINRLREEVLKAALNEDLTPEAKGAFTKRVLGDLHARDAAVMRAAIDLAQAHGISVLEDLINMPDFIDHLSNAPRSAATAKRSKAETLDSNGDED